MPQYEVWCHSCRVTFPVGTKNCLHCGARTRPERPAGLARRGGPAPEPFASSTISFEPADDVDARSMGREVRGAPSEGEEEPVRRSLLRAGMTLMWMILLAAGYAWRACSQQ